MAFGCRYVNYERENITGEGIISELSTIDSCYFQFYLNGNTKKFHLLCDSLNGRKFLNYANINDTIIVTYKQFPINGALVKELIHSSLIISSEDLSKLAHENISSGISFLKSVTLIQLLGILLIDIIKIFLSIKREKEIQP